MPVGVGVGTSAWVEQIETGIAGSAFSSNARPIAKRHPVTPRRTIVGMTWRRVSRIFGQTSRLSWWPSLPTASPSRARASETAN